MSLTFFSKSFSIAIFLLLFSYLKSLAQDSIQFFWKDELRNMVFDQVNSILRDETYVSDTIKLQVKSIRFEDGNTSYNNIWGGVELHSKNFSGELDSSTIYVRNSVIAFDGDFGDGNVINRSLVIENCFINEIRFKNTIFKKDIIFKNCTFNNASFENCKFFGRVNLSLKVNKYYELHKYLFINKSTFYKKTTIFIDTLVKTFENTSCIFKDEVTYKCTKLKGIFWDNNYEDFADFDVDTCKICAFDFARFDKGIKGNTYFETGKLEKYQTINGMYFPENFIWVVSNTRYPARLDISQLSASQISNSDFIFFHPFGFKHIFSHDGIHLSHATYLRIAEEYEYYKNYVRTLKDVEDVWKDKMISKFNYYQKFSYLCYLGDNILVSTNILEFFWCSLQLAIFNFGYDGEINFIITCLILVTVFAFFYHKRYSGEVAILHNILYNEYNNDIRPSFLKTLYFSCMVFISIKWKAQFLDASRRLRIVIFIEWILGILMIVFFFVFIASKYPFVKDIVGL